MSSSCIKPAAPPLIGVRGFVVLSAASLAAASMFRHFRSTEEDEIRREVQVKASTNAQVIDALGRPLNCDKYNVRGFSMSVYNAFRHHE